MSEQKFTHDLLSSTILDDNDCRLSNINTVSDVSCKVILNNGNVSNNIRPNRTQNSCENGHPMEGEVNTRNFTKEDWNKNSDFDLCKAGGRLPVTLTSLIQQANNVYSILQFQGKDIGVFTGGYRGHSARGATVAYRGLFARGSRRVLCKGVPVGFLQGGPCKVVPRGSLHGGLVGFSARGCQGALCRGWQVALFKGYQGALCKGCQGALCKGVPVSYRGYWIASRAKNVVLNADA